MTSTDPSDPWLSAVVTLRAGSSAAGESEGGGAAPAVRLPSQADAARTKAFFAQAGFEVHAPIGTSFSIAARRSVFERFFGRRLLVDEDQVGAAVTIEGDGGELTLEPLAEDVRAMVKSIEFPAPPAVPFPGS